MEEETRTESPKPRVRDPKVSIRLLHRCNFRCPVCSTFSSPDRRGRISLADFRKAVDILAAQRFRGQLNLSGGEPALHPDLPEMLSYAAGRLPEAQQVAVFTNGFWVGRPGWRRQLESLLPGPNVLVRFSLDRQHAEGAVLAQEVRPDERRVGRMEAERLNQARLFLEACDALGAEPGRNYDFAFKGTLAEARRYTQALGEVPLYLIRLRLDPARRGKEFGFLAVDVDEDDHVSVYPTLGHIPAKEPLGGLEALADALRMNREAMRRESGDG